MGCERGAIRVEEKPVERMERMPLDLPSSLIVKGKRMEAIVLNISRRGARLRVSQPISVGEEVDLELGRSGFVKARIGWCADHEAGAVFLDIE